MDVDIISEEENPMLHRTDIRFETTHEEATPSRLSVRDSLAAKLDKASEEVVVHDIDALESVTEETKAARKAAAEEVEAMIDSEFDRLLDAYKRRRADEAISTMYEAAEQVKSREVDTAISRLEAQGGLTEEQRETVESMADALVGQLLAAPTKSLRDAATEDDWSTIQTAMTLFDPDFGESQKTPSEEARTERTARDPRDERESDPKTTGTAGDREGKQSSDEELPQYVLESASDD